MMKYDCNMIRDIMPLCADKAASEESEKALIEHLAECPECVGYWKKMSEDLPFDTQSGSETKNYTEIAKKLRVKKSIFSIAIGLSIWIFIAVIGSIIGIYAVDGYKLSPEKALAASQNNIGAVNEKLFQYEWKNMTFYFCKNQLYNSCYGVEKSFFGWRHNVTYLSDPPENNGEGIVNLLRQIINYGNSEGSINMLPVTVYDENVVKIAFDLEGHDYSISVWPGYSGVLAVECLNGYLPAPDSGRAYDKDGNVLYYLDTSDEYDLRWVEKKS